MAKRDFIFIDESGDPGKADVKDSSDFYMVSALHVTDNSIREMVSHFCRLRYFHGFTKELKEIYKNPPLLKFIIDIYQWLYNKENVFFTSGYLIKNNYQGPYLSEDDYGGYDPKKFRNFIIRRVLERHFYIKKPISNEVEIVIDRVRDGYEGVDKLFEYFQNNYNLPNILNLVQVDSKYVEGIQLVDLLTRVVKAKYVDYWGSIGDDDLNFAEVVCLNQIPKTFPNQIHEA